MGSLKIADSQAESFLNWMTLLIIFLNDQGNDFGVGGDVTGNLNPIVLEFLFELLVIIDIAIQAGMDDAGAGRKVSDTLVVYGVTVGFGDGTD